MDVSILATKVFAIHHFVVEVDVVGRRMAIGSRGEVKRGNVAS